MSSKDRVIPRVIVRPGPIRTFTVRGKGLNKEEALRQAREAYQRSLMKEHGESGQDPEMEQEDEVDFDDSLLSVMESEVGIDFSSNLSSPESSEDVEEPAWNSKAIKRPEANVPEPPPKDSSESEEEEEEDDAYREIYVVHKGANLMEAVTPKIAQWIKDIQHMLRGKGGTRIVISPSARERPYMSPTGFTIGLLNQERSNEVVPAEVFDPYRMFLGVLAIHIPRKEAFFEFYKTFDANRSSLLEIVKEMRDAAEFQLRESFIGVFLERTRATRWKDEVWLVVRDTDVDASEKLFLELERRSTAAFMNYVRELPIEDTRNAAKARRLLLADRLFHRISGTSLDTGILEQGHEIETVSHDIAYVPDAAAMVITNDMGFVRKSYGTIVLGHLEDGLSILRGETGGWSTDELNLFTFPCSTGISIETGHSLPEDRFDGPKEFPLCERKNAKWTRVEEYYNRTYGMKELVLEPLAVALSRFSGHDLEESEFNDL